MGRDTRIDVLSATESAEASSMVLIERECSTCRSGPHPAGGSAGKIGRRSNSRCILRMDPMRECIHRLVMWLHMLNGHQANAIRQYLECTRILEHELRVSPMPETRALYDYIVFHNHAAMAVTESFGVSGPAPLQGERIGLAPGIDDYDEELARLRSLMSRLNSHRQSVFSALAEASTI